MLSAFRASCVTTLRHLEFNCAGVVSGVPFQGGLRHNLGCKNQRNAARAPAAAKTEKEKGLARQKEIDAALIKIANQDVKRPKRSPEELADAAHRVKEYSRLRMQHLRQFQRDQKIRERFRDDAIVALPARLRKAAMEPFTEQWSLKMLPPFDSPPKYPSWRL